MSNFTCQSKSFINIFSTCQVSACELQPFSCHNLANDIYCQTAKTVFSHLKYEDCHKNINTFSIIACITVVGRARLTGLERDRDRCFHSVAVRVDMPTFKPDWNIKLLLYMNLLHVGKQHRDKTIHFAFVE